MTAPETVEPLCARAASGLDSSATEIERLLRLRGPDEAEHLLAAAREQRRSRFGNSVFLYSFVQQARIMTFVPQEETPLVGVPAPAIWDELLTIRRAAAGHA